jgi:hypothetical protein
VSSLVLESFESSSVPCVLVTIFRYQLQKEKRNVPCDISSDYSIPPIHVERFIFPPFLARIVTGFGYSYTFNHLGCSLLHLLGWRMSHTFNINSLFKFQDCCSQGMHEQNIKPFKTRRQSNGYNI